MRYNNTIFGVLDIETSTLFEDIRLKDGTIEALSHQYDKRLEQLEKRLVSAKKRLKSCNIESK